jgi:hypothetical protein
MHHAGRWLTSVHRPSLLRDLAEKRRVLARSASRLGEKHGRSVVVAVVSVTRTGIFRFNANDPAVNVYPWQGSKPYLLQCGHNPHTYR